MIREGLAGKRITLTGVTGFLGTGLLERLLVDTDVERIDCIVRGDPDARLRAIVEHGAAFGPARDRLGVERVVELFVSKVRGVACDLTVSDPPVAPDCDLVIHSAATVSFDPPIDEAFATNLLGTTRLYAAAGGIPFVHVSTAYVAGVTRGTQPEEPLIRDVDWRDEAAAAARARDEIEEASRTPESLERFERRARVEVGRAGPQSIAAKAEELRRGWMTTRLVRSGQARARSLGWPDAYAFTKALTELALDELAGDNPLVIVRPSIIESAVERPFPGWIEGFRVAEPVILAYGRGALPEFPGIPEGALDLIPVDMVVNAILAVAARPLPRRKIFHVCSGARNPLTFKKLYELTREYFQTHPLPERGRGAYKVPTWSFPGRRAVEKRMRLADRAVGFAERAVTKMPRTPRARELVRKVDRVRGRLDFVKRYAGLYGPYVEVEVIYTDDNARVLFEALPPEDQRDFGFDPAIFTWQWYLQENHLPAITATMRWMATTPRRTDPQIMITPTAAANGNGAARRVAAVFDVEGTIVASNVLESYMWLRLSEASGASRIAEIAGLAVRAPRLLMAEKRDRGEFLRLFYRGYRDAREADIRHLAQETIGDLLLRKLSPAAVRRIRRHREAGHMIVFITGALDFMVEPISALADHIVSARLRVEDGVFTGDLERPPLVGEARSSWLRGFARDNDIDLGSCHAYADSMSDLPLLECVGNPAAVNPDVALARAARARRWPVEDWDAGLGAPRVLVPEALT